MIPARDGISIVSALADRLSQGLLSAFGRAHNRSFYCGEMERNTFALLILLLVATLTAGCASTRPASVAKNANADTTPGRWEIFALPTEIYSNWKDGHKWVRVPIIIQNEKYAFLRPEISVPAKTAKIYTEHHDYDAELVETSGSSVTPVTTITFPEGRLIPPDFRVLGLYRSDAAVKYYFQAEIPEPDDPKQLTIPGYDGPIVIPPRNTRLPKAVEQPPVNTHNGEIKGKARVQILSTRVISPQLSALAMHDTILVTIQLDSLPPYHESKVDIVATAIDDRLVLGAPAFDDLQNCRKGPFTVPPDHAVVVTICTIIPHGGPNYGYLILTGDLQEVRPYTLK